MHLVVHGQNTMRNLVLYGSLFVATNAVFNMWFIPISVLSVLPYFVVRVLRGREFYLLKKAQAKKVWRLEYLWKLFHNKQTVKEMRVMGFGDYLFQKWVETRDEVNKRGNMEAGYKRWDVNAVL